MCSKTPASSWIERHYGRNRKMVGLGADAREQGKQSKENERFEAVIERKESELKQPLPKLAPSNTKEPSQRALRPSLSEQLARIGAKASAITSSLRKSKVHEGLRFTVSTRSFIVGALESKFPSPVNFYSDRCEYRFYHPYEPKEIIMVMYYKDMHAAKLVRSFGNAWSFQFKIQRDLFHYGTDYQHARPDHHVSLLLNSGYDASQIRTQILQLVKLQRTH